MTRSAGSSRRWRQRQDKDPYVERAVREGWRSRAAFKLAEIDARERLFKSGLVCVDLGAAPGGFSQYAAGKVRPGGRVVAVDLLPMEPIAEVEFILGDFTDEALRAALESALDGRAADLVMSDMAPNISGNSAVDQPRSMRLVEEGLAFAVSVLRPGGSFLVKLFQGEGFQEYVSAVKSRFGRVKLIKPKASRPSSREIYLLAREYGM